MPNETMTNTLIKRFSGAVLLSLAASSTALASLARAPEYLYFNANCADCAQAANTDFYKVVATLKLDGYNYGTPLEKSTSTHYGNVVSFSYSGSNLVAPFHILLPMVGEITPPATPFRIESISGQINTSGPDWTSPINGEVAIDFHSEGRRFSIELDGDWAYYAGSDLNPDPNDYGHGFWSTTPGLIGPQNLQVPEPESLALIVLALAYLGLGSICKKPSDTNVLRTLTKA